MRVAIMQPYLFPYIGYFQMMNEVDRFVFYDDVQYIWRGWINRNRVLLEGQPSWLTIPVAHAPLKTNINQMTYLLNEKTRGSFEGKVRSAYLRAPYFHETFAFIQSVLAQEDANVARFNQAQLRSLATLLGMTCEFQASSQLNLAPGLTMQDRVISVCREIGASELVLPIGGLEMYAEDDFKRAGVDIWFIKAKPTSYAQFGQPHTPFLSIIDLLMFNGAEATSEMLAEFDRVAPACV